jgi:hypothetical protein
MDDAMVVVVLVGDANVESVRVAELPGAAGG